MGTDFDKALGWMVDPGRVVSKTSKMLTGKSGEQWLGIGQRSAFMGAKPGEAPSASAIPAPVGGATEAEKARIRKRKPTILTSPLTGGEDYGTAAPTLLGTGDTTKKVTLG